MENTKNIEAQSALTPPLKAVVVNGKKKIAVNGVVNLDIPQGGGGTQVQADWNQNDENAPDYIKNRICYEDSEIRIDADVTSDSSTTYFDFVYPIQAGQSYLVTFNDVEEEIIAVQQGNYIVLPHSQNSDGFIGYQNPQSGTWDGHNGCLGIADSSLYNNRLIVKSTSHVHKIDSKFIPAPADLGGAVFKIENGLKVSLDGGSNWNTVTLT